MTTWLRYMFVFTVIQLSHQLNMPLPPHLLLRRFNPGHLMMARKLMKSKQAHLMSKMNPLMFPAMPLSSIAGDMISATGFGAMNTANLLPMNTVSHSIALPPVGGLDLRAMPRGNINEAHAQRPNSGLMDVLNRELIHVVNAVPNVVSISVGSPDLGAVTNHPMNNGFTANVKAIPNTVTAIDPSMSNNMDFSGRDSYTDPTFNGETVPNISGFGDRSNADLNNNMLIPGSFVTDSSSVNNTLDNLSKIQYQHVPSSVNNGVKMFQSHLNNGGNLFELVVPQIPALNETDALNQGPISEGIPVREPLQPDRSTGGVNALIPGGLGGVSSLIPDIVMAGLANGDIMSPLASPATGISGLRDRTPVTQEVVNVQDISFKSSQAAVPVSPLSLPNTLLSFENAHMLIPITGKSRDQVRQSRNLKQNVLVDSNQIQPLWNSPDLLTLSSDIGKTDKQAFRQSLTAKVSKYDPFDTRRKPEAFGPGPYYECTPPAQVVCGVRIGWEHVLGMAEWCQGNCVVFNYSSYCDDDRCQCECLPVSSGTSTV